MPDDPTPTEVIKRFHEAESAYMKAGGTDADAGFSGIAATLDPDVVLHQSPDLPWGGEFLGHDGYEEWAKEMSRACSSLEVSDVRTFEVGDTVVVTCRLMTRSRATGEVVDHPMVQVVRVAAGRIIDFRPFYWNVPAYRAATPFDGM